MQFQAAPADTNIEILCNVHDILLWTFIFNDDFFGLPSPKEREQQIVLALLLRDSDAVIPGADGELTPPHCRAESDTYTVGIEKVL